MLGLTSSIYRNACIYSHHLRVLRCISSNAAKSISSQDTFDGVTDRYKGITVDTIKEKCSPVNVDKKLEVSLQKWKSNGNRCIWFKVNVKDAFYVPILAKKGFNFHHAREDFVMMYKWLPEESEANLPPSCHTNLAVGAMVFNKKEQILAVSEAHYKYPHWKLPGGYVERGEDIIDAAIREVKEETGVDSKFLSLITFRHTHDMMFNNTDIYVVLMMKALTEKITMSYREVTVCQWMDIKEYMSHPHVHDFNKVVANKALEYRRRNLKLDFEKRKVTWSTHTRDMNFLTVTANGDY